MVLLQMTARGTRHWKNLDDIDRLRKRNILEMACKMAGDAARPRMNNRAAEIAESCSALVESARVVLRSGKLRPHVPHLFMLAGPCGTVIDLPGTDTDLVESLSSEHSLGVGTDMSLPSAGINAISLAMLLDETVVVRGPEHTLPLFSGWLCICCPLKAGFETIGYIKLSLPADTDIRIAVPLLETLAKKIEHRTILADPLALGKYLDRVFSACALTRREREIAVLWINNATVDEIASALHLAKGTVQQVIKKIYHKTGVNGHCEFILKFLQQHVLSTMWD